MPREKLAKIKDRHKMIGWYDPLQLGHTAVEVLLSTIFGRHADKRIMQALADAGELHEKRYYEVEEIPQDGYWFDYISDVGDGFDSTYTMAYHVTRPELDLNVGLRKKGDASDDGKYKTQRGRMLVF